MMVRFIYVDDSGSGRLGLALFGWLACDVRHWRDGLRAWLEFRKKVYVEWQVPPSTELHATKFINGRGRISVRDGFTHWKALGELVARNALKVIGGSGLFTVGAAYRRVTASENISAAKRALYSSLVAYWDDQLTSRQELGVVFVDGDGTDPLYRDAHRDLPLHTRSLIEDPLFQGAHQSQWLQMADLVAYVAYLCVARPVGKEFGWDWYTNYLERCDLNGGPIQL